MDVKLIVASGKNAGQSIPVAGPKFFIGRADDCHLKPRSDLVSRHHCAILVEEGFVAVRDFGSRNGTFVNGNRVRAEAVLKNGDKLAVGQLEFELAIGVEVGGKKKPKVTSVQEAASRTAESAPVQDDDGLDLSQWLDGGDDGGAGGDQETRTMDLSELNLTTGTDRSSEETVSREDAKQTRVDDGGKFKTLPKQTTENSRDAAADVLKNFFKGR